MLFIDHCTIIVILILLLLFSIKSNDDNDTDSSNNDNVHRCYFYAIRYITTCSSCHTYSQKAVS